MQRTDRYLIAIALLILLGALGLIAGVDSWFLTKERTESDAVAEIVRRSGDVRVKFNDQLAWQKGSIHQKLIYNDAVFSGPDSRVDLQVGDSQLQLEANTLVVLRKDQMFKSLSLDYGILSGKIAKNDRLVIQTSSGEKFQLDAKESSKIKIERREGKTTVKVIEGNANVVREGKSQSLSSRDAIVLDDVKPRKADPLVFEAPTQSLFYTSSAQESVALQWRYSSGKVVKAEDHFLVEFSNEATFRELAMKEDVLGADRWTASVAAPAELYFRVRDDHGNFSETRKLSLRLPGAPWIQSPPDKAEFEPERGQEYSVDFTFSGAQPDSKFWFQVARDAEFKSLVYNRTFLDPRSRQELPAGVYYARVKTVYNQKGLQSDWSKTQTLSVRSKLTDQQLAQKLPAVIRIPNRAYPEPLYRAGTAEVQSFLKDATSFQTFFKGFMIDGYELILNRGRTDELPRVHPSAAFPAEWIYPGSQKIEYHLAAGGAQRSPLKAHALRIEMEAPNQLKASPAGALSWSPILFAQEYEGALTDELGKTRIGTFKSSQAAHRLKSGLVPGQRYAYQVRALGAYSRPISGWSQPHVFELPKPVAIPVAQKSREGREPSAEESQEKSRAQELAQESATSKARAKERFAPWKRIGYWLWAGSGFNYFNVRQTVSNTADVEYKNTHGPSMFLEAGYMASSRFGGVFAYKRTPGDVRVDNYPINKRSFVWDTYSAEMLYGLPWSARIFGHNISFGMRGGFQYHSFPFLYVQGTSLNQVQNKMLTGSAGAYAETDGRMRYHWHMRYQQPIQTSTDGGNEFTVTPLIAFDGSVGASYLLTERLKTGLFWYGQLHMYDFTYRSSTINNSGTQSLFYSNMELRLGYDF